MHLTPSPTPDLSKNGKNEDQLLPPAAVHVDIDMGRLRDSSHLVHYVYTPMLFLPKWRYEAHSTRLRIKSEMMVDENILPSALESGKSCE